LVPAVQTARMQLMVLVPLMVAALSTEGALRMRHVVPMALEVVWVCTSALLVADDSLQEEAY
jgi:hypothetical protein